MGMLRNLFPVADSGVVRLDRSADYDIIVVHVAPSEPDSIFVANLRALDDAGLIRLVERHTDEHGVLDVDDLADLVPDLAERATWACGPAGLLDALADALRRARPAACSPSGSGRPPSSPATAAPSRSAAPARRSTPTARTPILDAGEEAGVLMPSGCRMGICFGCVLPLREGAVRDLRNGELTTARRAGDGGVLIQTCVYAAAGACDIDH